MIPLALQTKSISEFNNML